MDIFRVHTGLGEDPASPLDESDVEELPRSRILVGNSGLHEELLEVRRPSLAALGVAVRLPDGI
jgi:hypothetical protein